MFREWTFPPTIKVEQFLVRVGDWGGYMLVECSEPADLQHMISVFPAFSFRVEPVLDVNDAVRAELEAIGWRDSLQASTSG